MNSTRTEQRKWSLWPVSIIAFFAVAILSCGVFVAFCSMNGTDLVASDYYEQEIRYQGEMESITRARSLNPPATLEYVGETGIIMIQIPAQAGTAVSGTLELYRPSSARMDKKVSLHVDASGRQIVEAGSLAKGPWKMKLAWKAGDQSYQLNREFTIGAPLGEGGS
jgi:hypothetical protein